MCGIAGILHRDGRPASITALTAMTDIIAHRGPDGEVFIDDPCIGCGNCQRNCPYGVIRMDAKPPKKPGLLSWLLFGAGPGPGLTPSAAGQAETPAAAMGSHAH